MNDLSETFILYQPYHESDCQFGYFAKESALKKKCRTFTTKVIKYVNSHIFDIQFQAIRTIIGEV